MLSRSSDQGAAKVLAFQLWQRTAAFGVVYWLCAQASQYLSQPVPAHLAFWLPAGLYPAVLLLNSTRTWPRFMLAACLGQAAFDLSHGISFFAFVGFYAGNTAGAVTGAWLMRRFVAERPALDSLREFLGLVLLVASVGAGVGALIGGGTLFWTGMGNSFFAAWRNCAVNAVLAVFLVTPFVLVWFKRGINWRPDFGKPSRVIEAVVLLVVLTGYTYYMLVVDQGILAPYKSRLMPFLLWAGIRFGLRGITIINLGFALWMAFLTSHYHQGLSAEQIASGTYIGVLQSYLIMSVLIALVPTIALVERDKNFQRLQDSEKRFRQLTEAAFEGIVISENGKVLDLNEEIPKMFHCRREEMIGREIIQFVAPEFRAVVADAICNGREASYEHQLLRPNGTRFYVEARAKMVPFGDRMLRMTAIRDISERKLTEQALRGSEERFRQLWNQSIDGIRLTDGAGNVLMANPAYCRLMELPIESVQGHPMSDVYLAERRAAILAMHQKNFTTRSVAPHVETQVTLWNGKTLWLDVSNSYLEQEGAEPLLLALFRDITGRKQAEAALFAEKTFSDTIINALPGIFYIFNSQGLLTRWNDEFARVLGGPVGKLPGHKLLGCITEDDLDKAREAVNRAYTEGQMSVDAKMKTEQGVRMFHFVARRLQIGDEIFLVGTGYDITEQKQMETQLLRAQRQQTIGTLASGVAHDINNILSPLLAGLPILREEIAKKDIQHLIDLMEASIHRGADIVKQLLIFGRGGLSQRLPVNPVRQIQEVAKIINETFPKNIHLETSWPANSWSILADPTQIYQVLLNLAVNSRDAMPFGGAISITAENVTFKETPKQISPRAAAGDFVLLRVRDTGTGMPHEVLDRIFEPFFTTKEIGKGTGLGLAVVMGVVESHGAFLNVQSKPGEGTDFQIYFPALPNLVESRDAAQAALPRGHGELILLVDDEPAILKVTSKILQKYGYKTIIANGGAEGLALYAQNAANIKAVITDLSMPGMDGLALSAALINSYPDVRILLATGLGDTLDRTKLAANGIKMVINKPSTTEAILGALKEVL